MSTPAQPANRYVDRPVPSSLADVIETILDKGLVVDAYVRVSLLGIELVTIDARIVVASVDTYLRFAEAVGRLDLGETETDIPGLVEGVNRAGAKGAVEGVAEEIEKGVEALKDKVSQMLPGSDTEVDEGPADDAGQ